MVLLSIYPGAMSFSQAKKAEKDKSITVHIMDLYSCLSIIGRSIIEKEDYKL